GVGQLSRAEPVNPEHVAFVGRFGMVNVDELLAKNERLRIVDHVAGEVRFHHWELRFADVFAERGGFDLIVGNPPWVKVEWNEGGLLGEMEPVVALRDTPASDIAAQRNGLLDPAERRAAYQDEFVEQEGAKSFLNASQNYPKLKNVQTNLYKCFITRAWDIGSEQGIAGFLHPEGVYDDPKGGTLRAELYPRLRGHYQFLNELCLFAEVHHLVKYSTNIYASRPS